MCSNLGVIRVKLTELMNSVNCKVREVTNLVREPIENFSQIAGHRLEEEYEKVEIPLGKDNANKENSVQKVRVQTIDREHTARGEYRPENGVITQTTPPGFAPKQNRHIEITPLQKSDYIQSRKGRLQVKSDVPTKIFETARLYEGVQIVNCKPILIKEYLLPESDFNQKEAEIRKEKFEELASLDLKNDGGQDFRLITPWDAIAPRHERRCYLITKPIDNIITLREYLEQTNYCPMTSKQVREVFKQVLQTLWFLHNQRVRFPNGEVCSSLAHGNLTLDSLLIVTNEQQSIIEDRQFFIYLSDLALWENLFKLPATKLVKSSPQKDLKDLGYLGFYLLSGGDQNPYGQHLDPLNEQHWLQTDDIPLKNFIRHLLGFDTPFVNADEARKALLATPASQAIEEKVEEAKKEHLNYSKSKSLILLILITSFSIGLVGILLVRFIWAHITSTILPDQLTKYSLIKDVNVKKIQDGSFKYTSAKSEGTWHNLITTPSLVSRGKTFHKELRNRGIKLKLIYHPAESLDNAFQKILDQKYDFLITSIVDDFEKKLNAKELNYEIIAYEGIVVFVPFADSLRKESITEILNGKITFKQLRKLYSGEITKWKQLNDKLPNSPIKLYIPKEEEVVSRFKDVVFKNHPDQAQLFQQLIEEKKIISQETPNALKEIFVDFEEEKFVGIGFGLLSQVYGQCSVYPLGLGEPGQEVQVLVQNNGRDIEPKVDLCNDKGSYKPNLKTFAQKHYPLGYPIAVVYPKNSLDGAKFAEILKTDEGQMLLGEAGLVSGKKLDNN